ncbi:MAG: zinc protease [Planctomycetota bacterium]|jgi:zinc protease
MGAIILSQILICALLCGTSQQAAIAQKNTSIPDHPSEVHIPPLRPFVTPTPIGISLSGGARLLVIESDELPLIDGSLVFRGGSRLVKEDQAGLAELMADVLRAGGSERTYGADIDRWLDSHAASISIESAEDSLRINFSCVENDIGTVLEYIGELLLIPSYPDAEIERSRRRMLTQLARRDEDTEELAAHLLDTLCFGEKSLSARRPSLESVQAITRLDLLRFHRQTLGTDRLVIGATGAVRPENLAGRLEVILARLPKVGKVPRAKPEVFRRPPRTRIYLYDRPDTTQTVINLAAPGTRRLHRDYVPLQLWSNAIGSGGTSTRMMVRLRTELGLIYQGFLSFQPGWIRSGRLIGSCSTGTSHVDEVVKQLLEITRASIKPIPVEELEAVRKRAQNSLVFELDSPAEVLERALNIELYHTPPDFWERRAKAIALVDSEEVAAAINRHLDVDRMIILVVGPAELLADQLEPLGELIRLPVQ